MYFHEVIEAFGGAHYPWRQTPKGLLLCIIDSFASYILKPSSLKFELLSFAIGTSLSSIII